MTSWFRRNTGDSDRSAGSSRDDAGTNQASSPPDAWLLDVPTLPLPPQPAATNDIGAPAAYAHAPHAEPLLEMRDVTIAYGQIAAVRNLSLTVGRGELVALLGANGAGKTTTLRTISGLHRARGGQIMFDSQNIGRMSAEQIARLGIAHLPEGRGMFPRLSVSENFRMAAYGAGIPTSEYGARLDHALQLFPVLGERMSQLAGTLSGGQQQMLAVARALLTRPRLLMIDELSFGLAPVVVKQLFSLIPSILSDGTAILLVEQFVGQALAVASRAYVLEKGELTFAGPAMELADREGFVESSYLGGGVQRPAYLRTRPAETEMLRVRVEPAVVRRLRAVGSGRSLHDMANEALRRYLSGLEAADTPRQSQPATAHPHLDTPDQRGDAR